VLACVAFCTVRDLVTKRIPPVIPSLLVSTMTAFAVTVCGALTVGPMGGWTPMSGSDTTLLSIAAMLVLIGYQFIIMAMRTGEISFIAPFRYTALVWAILLGYLIFADFPDRPMIAGALIVVGSGLYALYRERIAGHCRPAAQTTRPIVAPEGL
jgi:drug/metabolite transporter (DMT)-like permease